MNAITDLKWVTIINLLIVLFDAAFKYQMIFLFLAFPRMIVTEYMSNGSLDRFLRVCTFLHRSILLQGSYVPWKSWPTLDLYFNPGISK